MIGCSGFVIFWISETIGERKSEKKLPTSRPRSVIQIVVAGTKSFSKSVAEAAGAL